MTETPASKSWTMIDENRSPDAELPGARLRKAREHRGLALEEVAEELRLHRVQIEALENDNYERFSAPIFVSGYLRSYARLLGLDPGPLVAALEQRGLKVPEIRMELTATNIPMRGRRLRAEFWVVAVVIAATVVLAILWSLTRDPAVDAPIADDISAVQSGGTGAPETDASPASAGEPFADVGAPVPGIEDELVLRFSGSSWVEITDSTGRRLAVRMGANGDEWRLRGLAPFDILLGNATKVSLDYNGQPYTDYPVSRENVATFRVGGTGDE